MNFVQIKDKIVGAFKDGVLNSGCESCNHKTEHDAVFRAGARAMFDSLACRAANNYSGNPEANAQLQEESALVMSWAEDALLEVDPDDYEEWKSLDQMYQDGKEAGIRESRIPRYPS